MFRRQRQQAGTRRRRLGVEALESRRLLALTIAEYPLPAIGGNPSVTAVTTASNGLVYFGMTYGAVLTDIGALNPANGAIALYPTPATFSSIVAITQGSDGNFYFTDTGANSIGTFNPVTGAVAEYPVPSANSGLADIAAGPNGTIWFAEVYTSKIGAFNPVNGAIEEIPLNKTQDQPYGIVLGPDQRMWFTEYGKIAAINPVSLAIQEYPAPANGPIVVGPDGQLWFAGGGNIDEINPSNGVISSYPIGNSAAARGPLTVGPGNQIKFAAFVEYNFYNSYQALGTIDLTTHAVTVQASPLGAIGSLAGAGANVYFASAKAAIGVAAVIPAGQASVSGFLYSKDTLYVYELNETYPIPIAGATVYLDLKGTGSYAPGDPTGVSYPDGYFVINGAPAGTYSLGVLGHPGDVAVPQSVTLTAGQLASAGTILVTQTSAILPVNPVSITTNPFGTGNPDVSTAEVTGLYTILLHRAPDPSGLANYVSYLKQGGSLGALAQALISSVEYESNLVVSDYKNFLGRTASASEVSVWVAQLQGGLTPEGLAFDFLTSNEFNAAHPDTTSFLTALYADLLGVPAGPSDIAVWQSAINAGVTRSQVVSDIEHSTAADQRAVDGFYRAILFRQADGSGGPFYVNALQNGTTLSQVVAAMVSSADFAALANFAVS